MQVLRPQPQSHRETQHHLVKPSQTLSLTFMVSGFSLTSYGVDWVRQAPGKVPEWVGGISSGGSTYYNPSHTSISETSKNQFSLLLSSVTTEDMAVCCCARDTSTIHLRNILNIP
uniref:Immunoglobulin V-set domain-containing protein n=1 Tax=Bos indicus x Bos taurus TaxID=30522 RepID=A0A4W2DWZ9_BOBOX